MTATQRAQQNIQPWQIILVALGLLVGGFAGGTAVGGGGTPTTTTTTTTSTTTSTIPKPVGTTTTIKVEPIPNAGKPRFNPNASWNQPASKLGKAPDSQQIYAKRLYNFGGGDSVPPGGFNTAFGDYSIPEYPVSDATTRVRIFQATWSQNLYTTPYLKNGSEIPWNPNWKPGTGNDNLMMIVDENTGEVWELGGIGQLKINCAEVWLDVFPFNLFPKPPNLAAGYDINNPKHLCTTGGAYYNNLYTASDKDGTTQASRGMGLNKAALIARADEVKAGVIRHALGLTIKNTMFGPACSPVKGPDVKGFGVDCGGYLAPATKLERTNPDAIGCSGGQIVNAAERSKTVPEGARFAVNASDSAIEKWLDSRGYSGVIRNTARIFAVALRDYGFIVAESGCYGMHFETDSAVFGKAAPVWASLGIPADGTTYPKGDLMAGFIKLDNLYVVNTADEYVMAH